MSTSISYVCYSHLMFTSRIKSSAMDLVFLQFSKYFHYLFSLLTLGVNVANLIFPMKKERDVKVLLYYIFRKFQEKNSFTKV